MLKSVFQPIVEQKKVLIDCLLKDIQANVIYTFTKFVMRRVARGNRIVSINKVIFSHIYFLFDCCREFNDDFFTYSELAKTRN